MTNVFYLGAAMTLLLLESSLGDSHIDFTERVWVEAENYC
jgi:hypothetical protein